MHLPWLLFVAWAAVLVCVVVLAEAFGCCLQQQGPHHPGEQRLMASLGKDGSNSARALRAQEHPLGTHAAIVVLLDRGGTHPTEILNFAGV